jgi:hypothetical protein
MKVFKMDSGRAVLEACEGHPQPRDLHRPPYVPGRRRC